MLQGARSLAGSAPKSAARSFKYLIGSALIGGLLEPAPRRGARYMERSRSAPGAPTQRSRSAVCGGLQELPTAPDEYRISEQIPSPNPATNSHLNRIEHVASTSEQQLVPDHDLGHFLRERSPGRSPVPLRDRPILGATWSAPCSVLRTPYPVLRAPYSVFRTPCSVARSSAPKMERSQGPLPPTECAPSVFVLRRSGEERERAT